MSGKKYTIGIDPGKQTGMAVYGRLSDQIEYAKTLDFFSVQDVCLAHYPPQEADVIIEDCQAWKAIYARHGGMDGARMRKLAQNVGQVKRETGLLIETFRRLGYNVVTEPPISKKWDAKTVERVTGYKGRTSQHVRDAIKLAFGVKSVREQQEAA